MSDSTRIALDWGTDVIIEVGADPNYEDSHTVAFTMMHEERWETVTAHLAPKKAIEIGRRFIAMAKAAKKLKATP